MIMQFYRSRKENKIYAFAGAAGLPVEDKPCEELTANTVDAAKEKHVPVIEKSGNLVTVKVGSVAHPMTKEHYITFIAIETKEGIQIKTLQPENQPEAVFVLADGDEMLAAYAYCNLHGLWKAEA